MVRLNYGGIEREFDEDEIVKPLEHYNKLCNIASDINEHLPTLKKYGEECDSITEMGVRFAFSTWAFIESKPKELICYDIHYESFAPSERFVKKACSNYGIDFKFETADSLKIEIKNTDLLFIDTLHTYKQLYTELTKHSSSVNKYIILHDTILFGHKDEPIYEHASNLVKLGFSDKCGLNLAINDFLSLNDNWQIHETFSNNNGLTILKNKKYV